MSRLLAAALAAIALAAPATASSIVTLPAHEGEAQSVLVLGTPERSEDEQSVAAPRPQASTPMLMRAGVADGDPAEPETMPDPAADATVEDTTD